MKAVAKTVFTALALVAGAGPALAQPAGAPGAPDFSVTVGFAPVAGPIYQGADDYGFSVFPDIRLAWKDRFFASVPEGAGFNLVNTPSFKAGPLARIRFGREAQSGGSPFLLAGETDDLDGLRDIPAAAELGGFAQYASGQFRLRADIRRGLGGHEGVISDLSAQIARRDGELAWSFGPRTVIASADFVDVYFGVDAAGAAASGLPAYDAGGGVVSYGVGGSAVYPLSDNAALTFFGGYDRLAGDAAGSPLVALRGDRDQLTLGVAFGYRFGWGGGD